jgi:hypothetical protein
MLLIASTLDIEIRFQAHWLYAVKRSLEVQCTTRRVPLVARSSLLSRSSQSTTIREQAISV